MKIRSILAKKGMNVITITPDQEIRQAVTLLAAKNIGALVVVNQEQRPIGILSERDIIRQAAVDENLFSLKVADLMTQQLITGMPNDDTFSIAHTMTEKRFRHMPIVEDGKLVGIVSIGDIMKAERNQYRGEIDTLETQIMADDS
ncbi:MAG: CBS domain-containing protein [Anaerolineae bacterium]|nr:CBS domain-containing protein [Anaerolineae bacterium]